MSDRYAVEDNAIDECERMPENVEELRQAVVGHRIVRTERRRVSGKWYGESEAFIIVLDDNTEVRLADTSDCCAYTELQEFLLHPEKVDHAIMGVGTTEEFSKWHIYADWGDVLELTVGWSCGNPCYYGYGFDITVAPLDLTE